MSNEYPLQQLYQTQRGEQYDGTSSHTAPFRPKNWKEIDSKDTAKKRTQNT